MGASGLYNIPYSVTLTGRLNEPALIEALQWLIARHEILRTRLIVNHEGEGEQVIESNCSLAFLKVDLTQQAHAVNESIASLIAAFSLKPFDFANETLFRVQLVKQSEETHSLTLVTHHSIFDGWSMGIFCQELSVGYNRFTEREVPTLAPLTIQYADYTLWQRSWLQGEVLDKQLTYWQAQLKGINGALELPTDCPTEAINLPWRDSQQDTG